ncbi:ABC transporter permease [Listeria booriae]|uniref:ABC transporter permease n=1 Tax=Listeria booriae TaxID=1552123 RepID=A0A842CN10_9LIST|nr:ABC transporter permease [Listeria booriae]MBC2003378.1 ABC transporter permease [Listeria booriae]
MRELLILVKRHMFIYFADKGNIVFTCLSSIIVVMLYAFFIFDTQVDSLVAAIAGTDRSEAVTFVCTWFLAGQITLIIFGATFNAMAIFIDDMKYNGSDVQIFPLSKVKIIVSYCIQAVLIALLFGIGSLIIGTLLIWWKQGYLIPASSLFAAVGVIILGTIFSAILAMFIVTFMKTAKAFSSVQIVLNTLMGFLIGMYIPIGTLPDFMQKIIFWNPYMSMSVWLRKLLAGEQFQQLFDKALSAQQDQLAVFYGLRAESFDTLWSTSDLALFIASITVIIFAFLLVSFAKKRYTR